MNIWFWLFVAAYIGGGVNFALWLTDGGTHNTRVVRWRIFLVYVLWPVFLVVGAGTRFLDWFCRPAALPSDDEF